MTKRGHFSNLEDLRKFKDSLIKTEHYPHPGVFLGITDDGYDYVYWVKHSDFKIIGYSPLERIELMEQEIVLGVDRVLLEKVLTENPYGFFQEEGLAEFIEANLYGKDRDFAESDETFKQIIPYLVVKFEDKYLLYRRTKKVSETRLREKLSIGIGGHINPIDDVEGSVVFEALKRELAEEISVNLKGEPTAVGYINDDQNEVGRVHLGVVYTVEASSLDFEVMEKENIVAEWATKEKLKENFDRLETWSQLILDVI